MQKLGRRNTYTPTDASQVRSNCDSVIKHHCEVGEVLQNLKTLSNNSDVNQLSGKRVQDLRVPVLNMREKPLMPTTPKKARTLLKEGKAKVVKRKPFTIQLNYATGETKQPITLGIDSGYNYIGFSTITEKKELMSGEVKLRANISKKLQQCKQYRRTRRSRLWYRQPRFDNRKRKEGWLAPSIQHKLESHIRLIQQISKIVPITKIIVEVANFDIQKIKNPDIEGKEYQNGVLNNFWNIREYVLHRDNHTCQHCHGKSKDKILQVHHIHSKKEGATDRPEELLTVCKTCHENHHNGINLIPDKEIKRFKPETFMSTIRWKLVNRLREIFENTIFHTYGYKTKSKRIEIGLEKSHINDAFIIAGGNWQKRLCSFSIIQIKRNNRSIQTNRKGFKLSIRRQRYPYQPYDLVRYNGRTCSVKGVFNYGKWIRLNYHTENINTNIKNIQEVKYGKGFCYA